MQKNFNFIQQNKKGFSILEVLAAVFMLSIGLVAVMGLLSKNLTLANESRNRIVASGLAQEAIELVRNIRDTNFAAGDAIFDGITGTNCAIDISSTALSCGSGYDKTLYYSGANFYTHTSGGTATAYQRKVDIVDVTADALTVRSMVVWGSGGFPASLSDCTGGNKCTYSVAVLSRWQE